jgi:hypothetical protein
MVDAEEVDTGLKDNGPALGSVLIGVASLLLAPLLSFGGILPGIASPVLGLTCGLWGLNVTKDLQRGGIKLAFAGVIVNTLVLMVMSPNWLTMWDNNGKESSFVSRFCSIDAPPRTVVLECGGHLKHESNGNRCELHAEAEIRSALTVDSLRLFYARAYGIKVYPEPFLRRHVEAWDGFEDNGVYVAVHGPTRKSGDARTYAVEAASSDTVSDWRCQ